MEPDPEGIERYIRENRAGYTDQAIRSALLAAGHDPAAIDEALQRPGSAPPEVTAAPPARRGMSALLAFGWLLFIVGGITGLIGFGMAASFGSGGSLLVYLIAYIGIGLPIVLLLRWAEPRIRGVWAAVLGVVLIPAFGALMFGTCAAGFAVGRTT